MEFSDKLLSNIIIVDNEQVLIIPGLSAVGKVVRAKDDNTFINDHNFMVHLALDSIAKNIETSLFERVKLCADIGIDLFSFHYAGNGHAILCAGTDSIPDLISCKRECHKINAVLGIVHQFNKAGLHFIIGREVNINGRAVNRHTRIWCLRDDIIAKFIVHKHFVKFLCIIFSHLHRADSH